MNITVLVINPTSVDTEALSAAFRVVCATLDTLPEDLDPDVIVVNYEEIGVKGCRILHHRYKGAPIIAMYSNKSNIVEALRAGCVDFILKGSKLAEIYGAIKSQARLSGILDTCNILTNKMI
jgi:DNA-binding NarL/FixJ family response regulator